MIGEIVQTMGAIIAIILLALYGLYTFLLPFAVWRIRKDLRHIEELLEITVERMTE